MVHIGVVVDGVTAATAFDVDIGLEIEGEAEVGGDRVDEVIGLRGVRSENVTMRTPDDHSELELSRFTSPVGGQRGGSAESGQANRLGSRRLSFASARPGFRHRGHGAEPPGRNRPAHA
jgi:hypothetical protein